MKNKFLDYITTILSLLIPIFFIIILLQFVIYIEEKDRTIFEKTCLEYGLQLSDINYNTLDCYNVTNHNLVIIPKGD